MTMPPLPEFASQFAPRWPADEGGYSAAQMHAFAAAWAAATRADCLAICAARAAAERLACILIIEDTVRYVDARDAIEAIKARGTPRNVTALESLRAWNAETDPDVASALDDLTKSRGAT